MAIRAPDGANNRKEFSSQKYGKRNIYGDICIYFPTGSKNIQFCKSLSTLSTQSILPLDACFPPWTQHDIHYPIDSSFLVRNLLRLFYGILYIRMINSFCPNFRKRRSRFMSASEFIRICSLSTNLSVDCTVCQIENNNIQLAAPIWHDWVRECLTKKNAFLLDFVQMIFGLLTWHDRPSPLAPCKVDCLSKLPCFVRVLFGWS